MTTTTAPFSRVGLDAVDLSGKAIIVTGGTTGIGRAVAKLLAEQNANIFIFGRHEKELNDALHDIGRESHGITADQSRAEDVQRVFREADQRIGGCDILINNAAVSSGSVADKEIPDMRYTLETNVLGYMACAHEAIARMKSRGGGHIINIGSMSAEVREEGGEIYVATKAAIQAFSESLRKSANKQNIRVTLIEPGAVATPMQHKTPEQEREKIQKMEMLEPDDIAQCVLFCLTQPPRVDIVSMQVRPIKQII